MWGLILFITIGTLVTLLWLWQDVQEIDILIPIRFENIPSELTYSNASENGINLLVRGNPSGIDALVKAPPAYVVDLSGVTAGLKQIRLQPEALQMPRGVRAIQIHPDSITLKIQKKITKTLPVALSVEGEALTGYEVTHLSADPEQITVSGPESLLASIRVLTPKPLSIANASESFKKEIGLELPEDITVLDGTKVIVANITIAEKIMVRTLKQIKVRWRHTKHRVSISPPAITLEIRGTENTLMRLETDNRIGVFLDLAGMRPGVYVRKAAIELPVGTTLAGATPELFTVTLGAK